MKKTFLIWIFMFISSALALHAQTVKVGLNAGVNYFTLNSFFGESISGNGFGFAHETSYGVKAKYELPAMPVSLTALFSFTPLNSEGSRFFIRDYNDPAANTIDPRQHIEISSSLYVLGAGAEYDFYENKIFSAYFSADIIGAYFGKFDVKSSSIAGNRTDNIKGFFRLGAGFGSGIEIKTFSRLSLDISAKFNYYNLIGKKDNIYAYDYEDGKINVEEDYIPGIGLSANLIWSL